MNTTVGQGGLRPIPEPTEVERLRCAVRQLAKGLDWVVTDDPLITCVVCHQVGCNVETRIRDNYSTCWVGMHSECAKG